MCSTVSLLSLSVSAVLKSTILEQKGFRMPRTYCSYARLETLEVEERETLWLHELPNKTKQIFHALPIAHPME